MIKYKLKKLSLNGKKEQIYLVSNQFNIGQTIYIETSISEIRGIRIYYKHVIVPVKIHSIGNSQLGYPGIFYHDSDSHKIYHCNLHNCYNIIKKVSSKTKIPLDTELVIKDEYQSQINKLLLSI